MATKRAMEHLQALVELDERATLQLAALAGTLKQVIVQMDAILDDADLAVSEILTEQTTGAETQFVLGRTPVKLGSVALKLDGVAVPKAGYAVAGNIVTPKTAVTVNKKLRADYIVLELKAQTVELMAGMDDLSAAGFQARKTRYQQAIQWIEQNNR